MMLRVDERSGEDLGLSPGPKLNVKVLNSLAVNKILCVLIQAYEEVHQDAAI